MSSGSEITNDLMTIELLISSIAFILHSCVSIWVSIGYRVCKTRGIIGHNQGGNIIGHTNVGRHRTENANQGFYLPVIYGTPNTAIISKQRRFAPCNVQEVYNLLITS
jgi:hypothetical protein